MNLNSYLTKDYENKRDWTLVENKPNQSQSGAQIPTGVLLGILKPGTQFPHRNEPKNPGKTPHFPKIFLADLFSSGKTGEYPVPHLRVVEVRFEVDNSEIENL